MKNILSTFLLLLVMKGVFGATELVSVMEGDSVTLHTGATEIQKVKVIDWRFGNVRVAQINRPASIIETHDDELGGKFKGRLKLDDQTGDLTITGISTTDTGSYKVTITSTTKTSITFSLTVVPSDGVTVIVMERDSVTLNTSLTEIQRDDVIRWSFGQQKSPVAEISRKAGIFSTSDGPDGRFRDRLQLDNQTGSLIITNIRTTHSGLYEVEITRTSSRYTRHHTQSFNVTVSDVMVSVMAGDSVTLHTDFNITQRKHVVSWFDDQDNHITPSTNIDPTRDLTIRNIRRDQSGDYKVNIISSSTIPVLHRIFHINITGVFSNEKDGVKTVSVMNGHSFTLHSNVTDIQNDVPIEWMFGPQNLCIANTDGKSNKTSYSDDVRFINKLNLDIQTGDLSIQDSSTEHSGLYQLKIINSKYTIQKSFNVTVSGSGSGLPPAAAAGIVVGVVLLVAAAAAGGVIYRRKKQQKRTKTIFEEEPPQNPTLLNGNENGTELANTS